MPTVHDGIGTWYWGKTNIRSRRGVCEQCGGVGDLRSYDTTKYFVIFFVPVFSLGRKHIIDECPHCHRHLAVRLREWQAKKTQAITEATEACRREPNNVEAARKAIATAAAFQDERLLGEMVAASGPVASGNAEFQAALASAYELFSRFEEAEAALRASLAIKPDREVSESLAMNLLRQSRPDEAWELLHHIFEEHLADKTGLLLLAAESYQSWGMHEEALGILDDCVATFPELANDKYYKGLRKTSEKNRTTGKKIKSATLAPVTPVHTGERRWATVVPRLVLPAIVIIGMAWYAASAYSKGRSRDVFVVNGLAREYQADINGVRRTISAQGRTTITLPEGDLTIKILTPGLPMPEQTCRLRTSFWTRPVKDYVFVLNPDRTALLLWQEAIYSETEDPHAAPANRLIVGDLLTTLTDVEYAFQEMPAQIKVSSSSKSITKHGLSQIRDLGFAEALGYISEELGRDAAAAYVKRVATYDPANDDHMTTLLSLVKPDEVQPIIGPALASRPVRVEVHRYYQEFMERNRPDYDLAAEYRRYLEKDPDNPDLTYLLGRIVTNRDEAERLYQKAAHAQPPSARAFYALSYDRLANARFEEALQFARKARELGLKAPDVQSHEMEALLALGRFDEALKLLRGEKPKDGEQPTLTANEVRILAATGRASEAEKLVKQMLERSGVKGQMADRVRDAYVAEIRYIQGDAAAYSRLSGSTPSPAAQFRASIASGKTDAAAKAIEEFTKDRAYSFMILHLAATARGDKPAAERALKQAVEALRTEGAEQRQLANWLAAAQAPDKVKALRIGLPPSEKAVAMTILGLKFPEDRADYFRMARRLNYQKTFPHLLLTPLLGGPTASQPTTSVTTSR